MNKTTMRSMLEPEKSQNPILSSTLILQDVVMTAYSITGSLSAATELCFNLADESLPDVDQAVSVLARLHEIAMKRPKH